MIELIETAKDSLKSTLTSINDKAPVNVTSFQNEVEVLNSKDITRKPARYHRHHKQQQQQQQQKTWHRFYVMTFDLCKNGLMRIAHDTVIQLRTVQHSTQHTVSSSFGIYLVSFYYCVTKFARISTRFRSLHVRT